MLAYDIAYVVTSRIICHDKSHFLCEGQSFEEIISRNNQHHREILSCIELLRLIFEQRLCKVCIAVNLSHQLKECRFYAI